MKCNHTFPIRHLEQLVCIAWLLDGGLSALIASWFICISTAGWIENCLHSVSSVSNEDVCTPGSILSVTHHIVMQCAHSMWRFNGVVILLWFFVQNSIYEKQTGDGICFRVYIGERYKEIPECSARISLRSATQFICGMSDPTYL